MKDSNRFRIFIRIFPDLAWKEATETELRKMLLLSSVKDIDNHIKSALVDFYKEDLGRINGATRRVYIKHENKDHYEIFFEWRLWGR